MTIRKIALIGFGEVGQTLARDLAERNDAELSAYDLKFDDPDSIPSLAAARAPVRKTASAAAAVADADIIISAVTANSTREAAASASSEIKTSAWYFDVNSSSPATKLATGAIIEDMGGRFVEASIMSPIFPHRIEAPILLGGARAREFEAVAKSIGFINAKFYSDESGKAAAAKLCRSVIVKGLEALISESMLAAKHFGVEGEVISSLENLFPHPDWRNHARYMISRSLQHGERRAEEMREASRTVAEAGVEPWMANATVMRQAFAGSLNAGYEIQDLDGLIASMQEKIAAVATNSG